jgi:hypothetical protein
MMLWCVSVLNDRRIDASGIELYTSVSSSNCFGLW